MTEELQGRLRRIDPSPLDVPVDRPDGPAGITLMRRIMNTTTDLDGDVIVPTPARRPRPSWFRPLLAAAGLAIVVAGGVVAVDALRDGGDDPAVVATYQLAAGDPMAMCLPVADTVPDPSAEAFAGTVTAVAGGVVTLEVDRWYTTSEAADAEVVELRAGTDVSIALDGVEFVAGGRYLVTTVDGVVSICGVSAPASAELERLYEQWYG